VRPPLRGVLALAHGRREHCDTAGRGARPSSSIRAGHTVHDQQVGDTCGLPHPVIAQLGPRTWTAAGWLYTAEQLRAAVAVGDNLRRARATNELFPHHDRMDVLVCGGCGAVATVHGTSWPRWLNVVELWCVRGCSDASVKLIGLLGLSNENLPECEDERTVPPA